MGGSYDDTKVLGRTPEQAFDTAHRDSQWENGHGGYSGTLAEKDGATFIGVLPARITPERFVQLTRQWWAYEHDGFWTEAVYETVEETFVSWTDNKEHTTTRKNFVRMAKHRSDPRPKHLQTREFTSKLQQWENVSNDKWGPAAIVQLNTADSRKYKAINNAKGKRVNAYYIGGTCSS